MISNTIGYIRKLGFSSFFLLFIYFLNPFNYGFLAAYLLIPIIALKKKFILHNLDFNVLLMFLFSFCYGIFYSLSADSSFQFTIIYIFVPPFFYLWGKYIGSLVTQKNAYFFILIAIGTIFSITSLVSVLKNIIEGGFVQGLRSVPNFWTNELVNATGMAAPYLFNMCIPAILLAYFRRLSLPLKIFLIIIYIITLMCVLRLGSRTQLVITLVTFFSTLVYLVPKQSAKTNMGLFILFLIGVYLVFKNVSFDLDSDWLTSFAGRLEQGGAAEVASGGGRTERWVKSIEYIFEKPLGWEVTEFGHAHNLWFDTLRIGGVITFILLILLSFRGLKDVWRAIKLDVKNRYMNTLIINYIIAFNLLFMVEPILEGSFPIFATYCLFIGVLNKYYVNILNMKINHKSQSNL